MADRVCPQCGRKQPETVSKDCVYCGADVPEPQPEAPEAETPGVAADLPVIEPVAAPPPTIAPPPPPPADEPVPEGKRKCPACGEILYETERRCWRCGAELAAAPVTPPPVDAAVPPPPVGPVAPPPPPPADETPAPVVVTAPTPRPPYVPPATIAPTASAAGQNLGIWALVTGIGSWLCCPVVLSIVAIILGAKARREGATGLGMAGIILGVISLIWGTIFSVLAMIGAATSDTTDPATSWLWSLSCLFT